MSRPKVDAAVRFWPKVVKAGEEACWMWTGAKDREGYGRFWINDKQVRAHAVAFTLTHGRPPQAGSVVRHLCGNGLCVNPKHLAEGTHKQNWEDSVRHGTVHYVKPEGLERHPGSVFSNDDVLRMRAAFSSGQRVIDIVRATGHKYTTVWAAVRGQNYEALKNKNNNGPTQKADG